MLHIPFIFSYKANRQQNASYPDRSPGGNTCTSSDESTGEYKNEETIVRKRIKMNKRQRPKMHNIHSINSINSAFDQLRELIPTHPSKKTLTKVDTLRLACNYIEDLISHISYLDRHTHAVQGEDMQLQLYPAPMSDRYKQISGGYHVKAEMPKFSTCSPYRIPQSCSTEVS